MFTPRGEGYDFHCETRYDKLFTGLVVERPKCLREGGSPAFSPEDPSDSDYGSLLEMAHGKGMASLMPAGWNQVATWLQQIDGLRRAA